MGSRTSTGWVVALVALALSLAGVSQAAEFRAADRVEVPAGETVQGDLYATGQTVVVRGTVAGDLIAAGADIVVEGTVEGDLLAAGRSVIVRGTVGDDARITGAALELAGGGEIAGDLVAGGYSLAVAETARVGGDLVFGGRQALLEGSVVGRARIGAEALELRGEIGGDLDAAVSQGGAAAPPGSAFGLPPVPVVAPGLVLAPGARIGGDLTLTALEDIELPSGAEAATEGEARIDPVSPLAQRAWWLRWLERAIALTVVGLLLIVFLPRPLARSTERATQKPGRSVGLGLLTLFGTPLALLLLVGAAGLLAALLARLALGGLGGALFAVALLLAAAAALAFVLLVVFAAPVVVGLAGGRWLLARLGDAPASPLLALVVGVVLVTLLARVPLLGLLVGLAVAVVGLGALWPTRGATEADAAA